MTNATAKYSQVACKIMASLARQRYWFATGSAVIGDREPADYDFVLRSHPYVAVRMGTLGFKKTSPYPGHKFTAYRMGLVNVIMVDTWDQFDRWKCATQVAQALGLSHKPDRVRVFDLIVGPQ